MSKPTWVGNVEKEALWGRAAGFEASDAILSSEVATRAFVEARVLYGGELHHHFTTLVITCNFPPPYFNLTNIFGIVHSPPIVHHFDSSSRSIWRPAAAVTTSSGKNVMTHLSILGLADIDDCVTTAVSPAQNARLLIVRNRFQRRLQLCS